MKRRLVPMVFSTIFLLAWWAPLGGAQSTEEDRFSKGVELHGKGDLENALAVFQRGLKEKPDDYGYLLANGISYYSMGKYKEAERALLGLLAIYPSDVKGRLYLGHTYTELGKFDEAKSAFRKILMSDPKSAAALAGLGKAQYLSGDRFTAIDTLNKALDLQPDNKSLQATVAWIKDSNSEYLKLPDSERRGAIKQRLDEAVAETSTKKTAEQIDYRRVRSQAAQMSARQRMAVMDLIFQQERPQRIRAFPRFPITPPPSQ